MCNEGENERSRLSILCFAKNGTEGQKNERGGRHQGNIDHKQKIVDESNQMLLGVSKVRHPVIVFFVRGFLRRCVLLLLLGADDVVTVRLDGALLGR